jgi:signal peptidase I
VKRSHSVGSVLAREIIETIALTILIFLAIHFTVQNYQISGPSMQNTLHNGQFVLVNKLAYLFHQPERGDVIILHEPDQPGRDLVKRVIGLPGDKIVITSESVSVNGVTLNEPYVTREYNPGTQTEIVPTDQYFVMGDNRPVSEDSRIFGFVPRDYIVGKAILVYWPLSQWQILNTYSSVYSQIK